MTSGLFWQYAVIAVLVGASLLYMFRKLAQQLAIRLQAAASAALTRPGRGRAARTLGCWLRPREATGDCGNGCGTCGSCGVPRQASDNDDQPLTFHPPRHTGSPASNSQSTAPPPSVPRSRGAVRRTTPRSSAP
ncbi:DUF6587 family protein [Burkholderia mayonis]|uniref:DUF6587 family protein n=1 Tax=Burkholderia mayonis TaxID=1385591 RepID=UPI000A491193